MKNKRTFRNWPTGKDIPQGMCVYNKVWVIPEDLEIFMPPDEILDELNGCGVVYTTDGIEYDLFDHEYTVEED